MITHPPDQSKPQILEYESRFEEPHGNRDFDFEGTWRELLEEIRRDRDEYGYDSYGVTLNDGNHYSVWRLT